MTKKPFVIIDGFGVFFRSYYAHPEMITEQNVNINAVYGFLCSISRIFKDFKDADICIALDSGKATFRDKLFDKYKANRQATPDDLKPQFAILHKALEVSQIKHFVCEGYEADDIIATYIKQASAKDRHSFIVSLDKDLTQLLRYDNVFMYDYSKKKKLDKTNVLEKFGIMPEYVADYLALVGDSSDNIPGVRLIGPKTAANLINSFGSIENIYQNLSNIEKKATREALLSDKDNAFLSKSLTVLHENVDLPYLDNLEFNTINYEQLRSFTKEYNFVIN